MVSRIKPSHKLADLISLDYFLIEKIHCIQEDQEDINPCLKKYVKKFNAYCSRNNSQVKPISKLIDPNEG